MTDFFACVSYYSLPVFHEDCTVVRNHALLFRDTLTCNPANHHVSLGGQYDPHYESPEYKMCWPNARSRIWKEINNQNYEKIYLLFRTCLKNPFTRINSHHIAGVYEVDQSRSRINPDYNSPHIIAKKGYFVAIDDSVNIGYFYKKKPNPKSRFPFYSDTRDGLYSDDLKSWVEHTIKQPNVIHDYSTETSKLEEVYAANEFTPESYYRDCEDCESSTKCPLIKRIDDKNKVRFYIGEKEANRINCASQET